jgi:hypothetical protein
MDVRKSHSRIVPISLAFPSPDDPLAIDWLESDCFLRSALSICWVHRSTEDHLVPRQTFQARDVSRMSQDKSNGNAVYDAALNQDINDPQQYAKSQRTNQGDCAYQSTDRGTRLDFGSEQYPKPLV